MKEIDGHVYEADAVKVAATKIMDKIKEAAVYKTVKVWKIVNNNLKDDGLKSG